jgi:hypothetical protein
MEVQFSIAVGSGFYNDNLTLGAVLVGGGQKVRVTPGFTYLSA